jgi:voltage-gated potassium channel
MGYCDIFPVSDVGRFVTMLSAIFGVAIIALPAGIITACPFVRKISQQFPLTSP